MERRKLLRNMVAGTAMAIGASASASASTGRTPSLREGATHVTVKHGDEEVWIPLDILENGVESLNLAGTQSCSAECCENCTCDNCICGGSCGGC